ncbi:hypothetical protein E4U42_007474 [Claviceps africana]|uniref:Uncharacterized protein n=1 Tax=Claviceps africana TaxID=83212 RepID=A0A8K0NF41_9HYPO|nr:hypothetical protein E4U42_007474 [Claviceps africana]
MAYYFQTPIFTVPVAAPQPVAAIPYTVVQPAVFTVQAQPSPSSVVYVLPVQQVSADTSTSSSTAIAQTDAISHVPARRPTLRIVFYGYSRATTSSEGTTSPAPGPMWRRAIDHSFPDRPTLASFASEIPRLAVRAGVPSTSMRWRAVKIYVMYANTNGGVEIDERIGPVPNNNVLRTIEVPNQSGGGASGNGAAVQQGAWNVEMERWEAGQVVLYGFVCMEGGE